MFYKDKPDDDKDYEEVKVDSIIFYTLKKEKDAPVKRKKRYSDLLKDPLYAQQDLFRKLNMIKNFRDKNEDLPSLIEKWKECIDECIIIMQKDYEVSAGELFQIFQLEEYGFKLEDYE